MLYENLTDTIGGTPLVRLHRVRGAERARIYAKLEAFNPASSVKDRIAAAIIDAAEASGDLEPGGTIVEGTSGNTGIGLAMVGAARGYRVVLVMPDTMSPERRRIMRAFGAEIVLTPGKDGMRGAVETATKIASERENAILARQFENAANPRIHRETTAKEIWEDTRGDIDAFVAGIGTGGTVTGVGEVLKERKPDIHIVGVEPADSPILTGGKPGPHKIQGIGANFVPDILNRDSYSEIADVTFEASLESARELAAREGILAGISSGAALSAASDLAEREEFAGRTIVVLLPDTGERYLSTALFDFDED